MRRKEKEVTDRKAIEAILRKATVCRLGLSCNDTPYVVPLNHGYKGGCLYFHSSSEGKKIEMIRQNNRVSFEVDTNHEVVKSGTACSWTTRYRSVIGFGKASFVEDIDEKRKALDIIMSHHSKGSFKYAVEKLRDVTIIKVEIESMTGKQSGY